jgi:hypothetical protein
MLPSLRDFRFDDADEIAQAFRDSNYDMREKSELIPFFKTCRPGEAAAMMRGMESQFANNVGYGRSMSFMLIT